MDDLEDDSGAVFPDLLNQPQFILQSSGQTHLEGLAMSILCSK